MNGWDTGPLKYASETNYTSENICFIILTGNLKCFGRTTAWPNLRFQTAVVFD